MSTKGRYTHAGKLIREAQEYDITSQDQLVSTIFVFCTVLCCVCDVFVGGVLIGFAFYSPQ